MILFEDRLLPLRGWIYSRVKKIDPKTLHSLWVRCENPDTVLVSEFAEIEEHVTLHQGVQIRGQSKIGNHTVIDSNAIIAGCVIDANCLIHPGTIIAQSVIGNGVQAGPYAHIQSSQIGDSSHIGFTAQITRSHLGAQTVAKHHCYIGDTESGAEVNFGAGSITGNYDGVGKNKTIIEDGVFIGTNVNMIAPVTIGKEAMIAAGSTVTQNVPPHTLVIARAPAHASESRFAKKTGRGYERIKFGKERLGVLRAFLGEELPQWLMELHPPLFSRKAPLDMFLSNQTEFDQKVEQMIHSCCT